MPNIVKRVLKSLIKAVARRPFFKRILRLVIDEEIVRDIYSLNTQMLSTEQYSADTEISEAAVHKQTALKAFNELDDFVNKYELLDTGKLTPMEFLHSYYISIEDFISLFGQHPPDCDPFSEEYRAWEISFFDFLAGKTYSYKNEGYHFNLTEWLRRPPTTRWDMNTRINHYKSYADFLNVVRPSSEMKILEMGCGFGELLEVLGRCGCEVFGIEASSFNKEYSDAVLKAQKINANIIQGSFFDISLFNVEFDIVIFEASFHHCTEPLRLMSILHETTTPDCRVFFYNEPISSNFDRAWGVVRYDGESMYQIRKNGWIEFGYRIDFFSELLSRTGFMLKKAFPMHNGTDLYEVVKK